MWKFTIRRLLIMIPQLIFLSIIIFVFAQLMPGDALSGQIDPEIDQSAIQEQREKLGLDDPWPQQYVRWVDDLFHGDLGKSMVHKQPVTELMGTRLVNTIWLSLLTTIFIYLIGIPLGVYSGRYNDSLLDSAITTYTYLGFATPLFVFALLMLWIFGYVLGWFPTGGSVAPDVGSGGSGYVLSKFYHLILPAFSGAILSTVNTVQYLRATIIDTKEKDFILSARAKGAGEQRVYNRHILRNSFLPIAASLGYEITLLIGGQIFVEQIFSYPGMGKLLLDSVLQRDYSVVTATVMLFGLATILGTWLSDVIMSVIDPRIRIK